MTISSLAREHGVLKLVHPGGRVELHESPITAAEVMKRNPRHCVTRPDVFKYPWIVVRPESVLKPGRVFFVVPYHTIRRLLESNGLGKDHQSSLKHHVKHQKDGHNKPSRNEPHRVSSEEVDSIYDHYSPVGDPSVELARFHQLVRKQSSCVSENKVNHEHEPAGHGHGHDPYGGLVKKSLPVEPNVNLIMKTLQDTYVSLPKNQYLANNQFGSVDSVVQAKPKPHSVTDGALILPQHDSDRLELINSHQQVTKLKSSLKKHMDNSATDEKRRSPKVRFIIPVQENKESRSRCTTSKRVATP